MRVHPLMVPLGLIDKLEEDVERAAITWAESRGWLCLKMTPAGSTGWPDRLFVSLTGVHVWVEFKRFGEEPRKLQAYRLKQLRERAVNAHWCDTLGKVQTLIKLYED